MSPISLARFVAVLLAVGVLVGCDSGQTATSSVEITDESTIVLGETAVVDGVSVTFAAVETDSRCPPDAVCVWQGVAFVTLDIEGTDARGSVRFSVRVVDLEENSDAGVRVGDRLMYATALIGTRPDEFGPAVVTVATVTAD